MRAAQFGQNRRRRIAARSSVGRESLTCVSRLPQFGHRMEVSLTAFLCSPVRHAREAGI